MWLTLLLVLFAPVPVPAGTQAGETPNEAPLCAVCGDRGYIDCKQCKPPECSKNAVLFCSVVAACESCAGTGREECLHCKVTPAMSIIERKLAVVKWRAERQEVNQFMGRELVQMESAHFVLVFDVKGVKPGRKKLGKHAGAHLYLERLEDFHVLFARDLDVKEADWFGKTTVMIWDREADQVRASPHYTLQPSNTASKLMGAKPVVSIFYDKAHLHEEFELHQAVVHHVAHCLLSNAFDGIWPGNLKGGWMDGGLAHMYEVEIFGGVRHYCYVESDSMGMFKFGVWERSVLLDVKAKKELSFLDVTSRHTSEMTPEQHMFAWSFADFVKRASPEKLGPLARAIKQKQPIAGVIRNLFGQSLFSFHESWREWVLATYSSKKKQPRSK